MSYPVPFPLHYCLHQTSLFPDRGQHFYIRLLILPTHLLYSSPHPHLKSVSTTSLFIVHVSQLYNATDHTNFLTIRFFKSLFKPFVKSSFELLKATFAIAVLALTSSTQVPFYVITAPRYLNVVTCSTRCPSTTRFTTLLSSRETTIAFVFLTF